MNREAPATSALSSSINFAFARFYLYPHWRKKKGQNTIQLFLHGSQKKANCTLVLKTDFLSLNHKKSRLLTFLCTWRKINHFIHCSDAVFLRERVEAVTKEIRESICPLFPSSGRKKWAGYDSKTLMLQIKQVALLGTLLQVWEEHYCNFKILTQRSFQALSQCTSWEWSKQTGNTFQ